MITADDLEPDTLMQDIPDLEITDDTEALGQILSRIAEGRYKVKLWPTIEEKLIRIALRKARGNQSKAARILGIHRNTLRNRIQRYSIALI
jgi:DNA-binding protein Fis